MLRFLVDDPFVVTKIDGQLLPCDEMVGVAEALMQFAVDGIVRSA